MKSTKKTRVAVIGCGVLGTRHAEIYSKLPGTELVGVCDIHISRAQDLAHHCGTKAFSRLQDLEGKIDAASICVPAVNHYAVSKKLLERDVDLLIEKPITTRLDHADQLIRLARKRRLILQVGHVERFNSAVQAVRKILHNPRYVECDRIGPYNPRIRDVGVILDLMIHDIDIIMHLVNSPVSDVKSVGIHFLSATEDFANSRIVFKNGTVGNLTASRMAQDSLRKIRIFQDTAYISLDYKQQKALICKRTRGGIRYRELEIEKSHALVEELASFIRCVRTRRRPLVSGLEARAALEVALKIISQIKKR